MVKLNKRRVEVDESKVVVDGWEYDRKIDALGFPKGVSPVSYILLFRRDEATSALSAKQQLNGLAFNPMIQKALRQGLSLARVRDFTSHHRAVNLALQEKGVLYDASGNLIDGNRLIEVGEGVNNAWIYLNDAYEESAPGNKGFLGLNLAHVIGFDGEKPVLERQPLEECVVDCWADTESINDQGYYTKRASVQGFEKGKTVFVHRPVASCVAWFGASPGGAVLILDRGPQGSDPLLGGSLRAEGTSQNKGVK